jgi:tetratricopeptide (TPR) repeat protein
MKPKELLFAHRYEEAAVAFRCEIASHPELNFFAELGRALLGQGLFAEALDAFKQADQFPRDTNMGIFSCLREEGAALWLMGRKQEALTGWRKAVDGVLDGTVRYGDAAGGVTQGLLMWFGAVTLGDGPQKASALSYLKTKTVKQEPFEAWPRPLATMVLGQTPPADVLHFVSKGRDLNSALKRAKEDLLTRRRLCQYLFYSGCQARETGDERSCLASIKKCAELENPILEVEWHLARSELRAQSGDRDS